MPRPAGSGHAGIGGNLFKGAITAIVKERVAGNLRTLFINGLNRRARGSRIHDLTLSPLPVPGQHVRDTKIHLAVPIHVGKINPHRKHAGMAQGRQGTGPKMTLPVVEPQPVGRPKVIAHVNIRRAVTVQIAERF